MRSGHINKKLLRWLLPVAIVVLSVFLLQAVFSQRAYRIQGITPQDGVLEVEESTIRRQIDRVNELHAEVKKTL